METLSLFRWSIMVHQIVQVGQQCLGFSIVAMSQEVEVKSRNPISVKAFNTWNSDRGTVTGAVIVMQPRGYANGSIRIRCVESRPEGKAWIEAHEVEEQIAVNIRHCKEYLPKSHVPEFSCGWLPNAASPATVRDFPCCALPNERLPPPLCRAKSARKWTMAFSLASMLAASAG